LPIDKINSIMLPLVYFKTMPLNNQNISINNLPDLLTVREVAQILRVSSLTIKRWGKRGKLPAIRINSRGDRRYKKEAVLWLLGIQEKTE
jgi:excisionase family DNA binding protein